MKHVFWIAYLILMFLCGSCSASVPHHVDRYGFSMQLPEGFTYLVEKEDNSQRNYDGYIGSASSKSFVHVWIAASIDDEDYVGDKLENQVEKAIEVYKKQGADVISTEIVKLPPHEGFIIHSKHDGMEFLTLMMYCNCVMYVVSANIAKGDKYGVREFYPVLMSVGCK